MSAPQLYVGQEAALVAKWLRYKTSKGKPAWKCYRTAGQRSQTDAGRTFSRSIYADMNGFLDPVDFRGQLVT